MLSHLKKCHSGTSTFILTLFSASKRRSISEAVFWKASECHLWINATFSGLQWIALKKLNSSRIRFCIQSILGNNEGGITKQKRQRGAELSNDLVICLPAYIFTVLINSFIYIYLLTDAVSGDTQLWSHPVTVSLLEDGTGWIQVLRRG